MAAIMVTYRDWSPSPFAWEALFVAPIEALRRILTRLEREPHQVALRPFADQVDVFARIPDLLDENGKPAAVVFAEITEGLTLEEAKALQSQLKSEGWKPSLLES